MIRKTFLPVLLGTALLGSAPAIADPFGNSEQTTEKRSCEAPASGEYSAPGPEDCQKQADGTYVGDGTYQATHYTNDVECGDDAAGTPANPSGVRLAADGDEGDQSGAVGLCSEGGSLPAPAPVQGRATVSGGTSDGVKVVVDGDEDNGPEQAQGWVSAESDGGAPVVRCGDADGHKDSDAPEDEDGQEDCG